MSKKMLPGDIPRIGLWSGRPSRKSKDTGALARVYQFDATRGNNDEESVLPEDIWDEIERAHRFAEKLAEKRLHVRFVVNQVSGRIFAIVCNQLGEMLFPLDYNELFGNSDAMPDPPLKVA